MAKLIVNPTSSSRREIPLPRTLTSIGRDPTNDVVLPDAMVSRRHAVIEYRGGQYYLRDCNSSNGSLVNGDRISEHALVEGDLMAVGTARLLFRADVEMAEASGKVVPHPSSPRLSCPACHADFRKGDLYCRQCGLSLAGAGPASAACSACGTAVAMPARFCTACGHKLPEAAVATEEPAPADGAIQKTETVEPLPDAERAPTSADAAAASSDEARAAASEDAPAASSAEATVAPPPSLSDSGAFRARGSLATAPSWPAAAPLPDRAPREAERRPAVRSERMDPSEASEVPAAAEPGGALRRLAAALADTVIVTALAAMISSPAIAFWLFREVTLEPSFAAVLLSVAMVAVDVAVAALYYIYYWGMTGATPGKRLLGLVVQTEAGRTPIGTTRATVRLLGYFLSFAVLGVGFLMVALGGVGLHDYIAGTRVVRRRT